MGFQGIGAPYCSHRSHAGHFIVATDQPRHRVRGHDRRANEDDTEAEVVCEFPWNVCPCERLSRTRTSNAGSLTGAVAKRRHIGNGESAREARTSGRHRLYWHRKRHRPDRARKNEFTASLLGRRDDETRRQRTCRRSFSAAGSLCRSGKNAVRRGKAEGWAPFFPSHPTLSIGGCRPTLQLKVSRSGLTEIGTAGAQIVGNISHGKSWSLLYREGGQVHPLGSALLVFASARARSGLRVVSSSSVSGSIRVPSLGDARMHG